MESPDGDVYAGRQDGRGMVSGVMILLTVTGSLFSGAVAVRNFVSARVPLFL